MLFCFVFCIIRCGCIRYQVFVYYVILIIVLPPFGPGCALILGVQEGGGGGAVLLLILGVHWSGGGVLLLGAALGHGGVRAYLAVVVLGPVLEEEEVLQPPHVAALDLLHVAEQPLLHGVAPVPCLNMDMAILAIMAILTPYGHYGHSHFLI